MAGRKSAILDFIEVDIIVCPLLELYSCESHNLISKVHYSLLKRKEIANVNSSNYFEYEENIINFLKF